MLVASDVHAIRFDAVRHGEPVADAEICLFRAAAEDDPVARFFASHEVRCAPASTDIEIGAGKWSVFARRGDTLVSERVELVTAEEAHRRRDRLHQHAVAAHDVSPPAGLAGARPFGRPSRHPHHRPVRVILVPQGMLERYPDVEMPFVPEMGSFPQKELGESDTITF